MPKGRLRTCSSTRRVRCCLPSKSSVLHRILFSKEAWLHLAFALLFQSRITYHLWRWLSSLGTDNLYSQREWHRRLALWFQRLRQEWRRVSEYDSTQWEWRPHKYNFLCQGINDNWKHISCWTFTRRGVTSIASEEYDNKQIKTIIYRCFWLCGEACHWLANFKIEIA